MYQDSSTRALLGLELGSSCDKNNDEIIIIINEYFIYVTCSWILSVYGRRNIDEIVHYQ